MEQKRVTPAGDAVRVVDHTGEERSSQSLSTERPFDETAREVRVFPWRWFDLSSSKPPHAPAPRRPGSRPSGNSARARGIPPRPRPARARTGFGPKTASNARAPHSTSGSRRPPQILDRTARWSGDHLTSGMRRQGRFGTPVPTRLLRGRSAPCVPRDARRAQRSGRKRCPFRRGRRGRTCRPRSVRDSRPGTRHLPSVGSRARRHRTP